MIAWFVQFVADGGSGGLSVEASISCRSECVQVLDLCCYGLFVFYLPQVDEYAICFDADRPSGQGQDGAKGSCLLLVTQGCTLAA
jgi:hypothetical protein